MGLLRYSVLLCGMFSCAVSSVCADAAIYSKERLRIFYEEYLCEARDELAEAGIEPGSRCTLLPEGSGIPPILPFPPTSKGLLPIAINNSGSGESASDMYIVVTGRYPGTTTQLFLQMQSGTGITRWIPAVSGENSETYSFSVASLPAGIDGLPTFYSQKLDGGLIWFSVGQKLNMPVDSGNAIVQPSFLDTSDPNYYVNFDVFEYQYGDGSPNVNADATAVSFFSMPLQGFLSTPGAGSASETGLTAARSTIMTNVYTVLSTATSNLTGWQALRRTNGPTVLRISSPGKAMAAGLFDTNYLDHLAAYTYSYISDVWNGATSYYKTTGLGKFFLTIPNGTLATYSGVVNGDNSITFTSQATTPTYTVVLSAPTAAPGGAPPTTNIPTTTYNIFSGLFFIASDNSPGAADGIQLNKLLEEGIIAGLVPAEFPSSDPLSNAYLVAQQPPSPGTPGAGQYYTVNPNLTAPGGTTGPWYDLYSKGLHEQGHIYTFGYDEPLWPQVLLGGPFIQGSTYLKITIGNLSP